MPEGGREARGGRVKGRTQDTKDNEREHRQLVAQLRARACQGLEVSLEVREALGVSRSKHMAVDRVSLRHVFWVQLAEHAYWRAYGEARLCAFLLRAHRLLCRRLTRQRQRFPNCLKLLRDFYRVANPTNWERRWTDGKREIYERVNEVALADAFLSCVECAKIEYEPPPPQGGKRIDFRVAVQDGRIVYCDAKTIHPLENDDWVGFEKNRSRFPPSVRVMLDQAWQGGTIWHQEYAARSKIRKYVLELEHKITRYPKDAQVSVVLCLWANGYDWHPDTLRSFAYFYRTGRHLPHDKFSGMDLHGLGKTQVRFTGNVDRFWYFERKPMEVRPRSIEAV